MPRSSIPADEIRLLRAISTRAAVLSGAINLRDVRSAELDTFMDLTATLASGRRLRLAELAAASDIDFIHDVCGIRRHLDRKTGQLRDGFVPRYAGITRSL